MAAGAAALTRLPMRAVLRLLWATAHAVHGWFVIVFVFPRLSAEQRELRVQIWATGLLRCLGVRLQLQGIPPRGGPMLLVANHISFLDILVMHAARHCRFVSKADVKRWPMIGTLATGAGTLYIMRAQSGAAMAGIDVLAIDDGPGIADIAAVTGTAAITCIASNSSALRA